MRIRKHRTDTRGHLLKAAKPRSTAAVAGGLLQVKAARTNSGEAFAQREMLRHRRVNVKLLSALIVGRGVLGVYVVADVGGGLETVVLAEIADQHARLESPVTQ